MNILSLNKISSTTLITNKMENFETSEKKECDFMCILAKEQKSCSYLEIDGGSRRKGAVLMENLKQRHPQKRLKEFEFV